MTEHYVTLFDSNFLPQGLALHASMERHAGNYRLWIACIDDVAYDVLTRLALPNCSPLRLSSLETDALRAVKPDRTRGEYCWTLTPFTPKFVFDADPSVRRATYIDADIWFRKHPAPIFTELERSGASVLITDHGYTPEYDQSAKSGQYCVQFMVFNRDGGEPVRQWWENRCIEWCFAYYEDGKFGDQKYLDDWPYRFDGLVHVLQAQQLTQAPWNSARFPYSQAIIYHFHGLRILPNRRIDFGPLYALPKPVLANIYEPYVRDLRDAIKRLEELGVTVRPQKQGVGIMGLLQRTLGAVRRQGWRYHQLNFNRY